MIRADCSRVGGLEPWLPPMQAKAFQIARGEPPVAQMSFAPQVTLAWQRNKGRIWLPLEPHPSKFRKNQECTFLIII
jgi:hypothetical protein